MKGKFYFFVLQGSPKNFNFVLTLTWRSCWLSPSSKWLDMPPCSSYCAT
jgi:hypothetical protein